MYIKTAKNGVVKAIVGKDEFALFDKGEQTPESVAEAVRVLNNVLDFEVKAKDLAEQIARNQAEIAHLKMDIASSEPKEMLQVPFDPNEEGPEL